MLKRILVLSLLLLVGTPVLASSKITSIKPLNISVDHGINLTLSAPASSVFVANPEIADVQVMSPTSIMIFGKRTGETSFVATDSNGRALEERTLIVMQDLTDLRQELDVAIPGNKIHAAALPNGIVLTGEAKDAATIADAYKMAQRFIPPGGDIINRVHVVGSNQIHIRVRFAEVSRSVNNTFGIDWGSALNVSGMVFGLQSGSQIANAGAATTSLNGQTLSGIGNGINTPTAAATAIASPFSRPSNPSLTLPNNLLSISRVGGFLNLNTFIDALAQDGLVTILAEPNLTAMSGETASFLAGGEIPVPIPQTSSGGAPVITVEWKNYGISLEFTPTLIGTNRISLHVKPEVSQLTTTGEITTDNITIPGLLTRKAETTVEVASGQSFAIAGLLDNQQAQTVNKFPLLGDLPVLGALFRSSQFQNNQSELVVLITPYIVTPNGEQQLALPTDGLSPPTENDRLVGLRYSGSNPNARTISGEPVALPKAPDAAPVAAVTPYQAAPAAAVPVAPPFAPAPSNSPPPNVIPPATDNSTVKTNLKLSPDKVISSKLSPEDTAPSGPGGFILE